jgi:hypothetical protein
VESSQLKKLMAWETERSGYTTADVQTLLAAFLNTSLRTACVIGKKAKLPVLKLLSLSARSS